MQDDDQIPEDLLVPYESVSNDVKEKLAPKQSRQADDVFSSTVDFEKPVST